MDRPRYCTNGGKLGEFICQVGQCLVSNDLLILSQHAKIAILNRTRPHAEGEYNLLSFFSNYILVACCRCSHFPQRRQACTKNILLHPSPPSKFKAQATTSCVIAFSTSSFYEPNGKYVWSFAVLRVVLSFDTLNTFIP